jgi:predicted transposase YbfD/YdcC
MECTPAAAAPAAPVPLVVSPPGLLAAFAAVPDPRRQASVAYPLPALLALAVTAILANQHSPLAIAEWAARQGPGSLAPLGFADGRTPCQSTLHRACAALGGGSLAAALGAYFARRAAPDPAARGGPGVALDGKAQRGRLRYQTGGSAVHALTAFCHEHGVALAQEAIDAGAAKAEAELTVAPALIARLDWRGRVLTGDALFCQRHLCGQVVDAGGDYLVLVRENQPTLLQDIALLFDPPADLPAPLPLLDRREAVTLEQGHGRTHDRRHLVASTDLAGYLAWPGLAQVFRLERTWRAGGTAHRQLTYGVTSLPPDAADAARLLALKRGHWSVENGLHRAKDVALGEDRRLIHTGAGPMVMSLLRDTALGLLYQTGRRAVTSRLRALADGPAAALALVLDAPATRA